MPTYTTSIPYQGSTLPPPLLLPGGTAADVFCDAATASAALLEPEVSESPWFVDLAVEAAPYSIRIPVPAGDTRCPRCGSRFLAAGPTGFAAEQPICDLCLLDGSPPLGMLVALAAVVRAFGAVAPEDESDYREASEELATFARVYERVAAKSGPPRTFKLPEGFELL